MKLICRYSAELYFCDHFKEDSHDDVHPIFRLPARKLLLKAKKWGAGQYDETEQKLLFLALMNTTGAVDFTVPASPSHSIVSANMESMFRIVTWFDTANPGTLRLPTYRVSELHYRLENINTWIAALFECREEWKRPSLTKNLQDALAPRELVLDRYINSPTKHTSEYATKLARWAISAAGVTGETAAYWLRLFQLKDNEIFKAPVEDLEKMMIFLETKLFEVGNPGAGYGGSYARKTLQHVRELYQTAKGGPLAMLTGGQTFSWLDEDEEYNQTDYSGGRKKTFDHERINTILKAKNAPAEEPKQINYPGNMKQYILDRAAWTLAQMLKENK